MKVHELSPDHKNMLLQQPHQLYVADEILNVQLGPYTTYITLSNTSPNGMPLAVCTINASTKDWYEIAKRIVAEIEGKKKEFEAEYQQFVS